MAYSCNPHGESLLQLCANTCSVALQPELLPGRAKPWPQIVLRIHAVCGQPRQPHQWLGATLPFFDLPLPFYCLSLDFTLLSLPLGAQPDEDAQVKAPPLFCVSTAFAAKAVPFLADLQRSGGRHRADGPRQPHTGLLSPRGARHDRRDALRILTCCCIHLKL